jgi:CheY-like chemotaxis protein
MRRLVLVVADDEAFRAAVADLLGNVGLATCEATTGEDALIMAEEVRPDLAVLETLLPAMSGYELCHELRERFGDAIGLVFASATRTEPGDRVAGLLLGADDYIVRPFAPDEFVARVRRLLVRPAPALGSPSTAARLTRREREVLSLLIEARARPRSRGPCRSARGRWPSTSSTSCTSSAPATARMLSRSPCVITWPMSSTPRRRPVPRSRARSRVP